MKTEQQRLIHFLPTPGNIHSQDDEPYNLSTFPDASSNDSDDGLPNSGFLGSDRSSDDLFWTQLLANDECIPFSLCQAASVGDLDSVKQCITRGLDVNDPNSGGWTALMYAAYIGHNIVSRYLLDSGAKPEARNNQGRTSLILAASCGNDKTVKLLLEYQANPCTSDPKGWDALFYASRLNHQNVALALLRSGADPNRRDGTQLGLTPFLAACGYGHERIVETFLQFGVDLSVKSYKGDSGRDLAVLNCHEKIVRLLDTHRQSTPANSMTYTKKPVDSMAAEKKSWIKSGFGSLQRGNKKQSVKPLAAVPATQVAVPSPTPPGLTPTPDAAQSPRLPNMESNSNSARLPDHPDDGNREIRCQTDRVEPPRNLPDLLRKLDLTKYLSHFEEQQIDFPIFLTMSDAELKEIGIRLMGPRKKLANAIARFHGDGPMYSLRSAEAAYGDYQRSRAEDALRKSEQAQQELESVQEELEKVQDEQECLQRRQEQMQTVVRLAMDACRQNKQSLAHLLRQTAASQYRDSLLKVNANCDAVILKCTEYGF